MPSLEIQGAIIADRFVLGAVAGAGGMGKVYRAGDNRTGRTVAVKLLHESADAVGTERFSREAKLLAELRHPGIVEYLDHGVTEGGRPYLAMEWLEGEDLARRLSRGPLSLAEGLTLARCVAESLAVMHTRSVVHRDLKPSNLFLRDGEVARAVLLDFGIARRSASSLAITGVGTVMGTPAYMSPEQARASSQVSPAADVFSLGCVLFECLAGEAAFYGEHVVAVLAKILFAEPPRLCRLRPEIPPAIEALLARMLQKDPAVRLRNARAVLAELGSLDAAPLLSTASAASEASAALSWSEASEAPSRSEASAANMATVENVATVDNVATAASTSVPRHRPGDTEQRLVSVLVATPQSGAPSEQTITMKSESALARALSAQGAHVELLADGSLVATLVDARGAATDQAAQAARCALLIQARWPEAEIALCTGRGRLREGLPIGEVVDRAILLLRRRTAGPAEQILLDELTRGLLDARFRTSQTQAGTPVLLGEELTLDPSRPLLGKPTPCVGREPELDTLARTLAACVEDETPRAVLVTAPPGAGKSRLRHEILRRIEAQGGAIQILIGRGDPMSAGSAYGMLGQALRRFAGIVDGEALEVRRAKLARRVAERLPAAESKRVAAFAGELCGVPFPDEEDDVKMRAARHDPLIMSDQITLAVLDLLRAECAAGPLLLVLEDLHWSDALTVKLCEAALRGLGESPLMVLAFARPEVQELLSPWWSDHVDTLALRPLSKKAGERLAYEVLGAAIPRPTVARIVEQSEGNALFLEELIRNEVEGRGFEAPETVLAILQARIGRLEAGARRVLRAASVFGATAWVGGIRALLGAAQTDHEVDGWLRILAGAEILEERRESRFSGEREVRFRHALTRDAAYGLLTAEDATAGHRVAAGYLEACGEPDALVLAEHFEKGREEARAIAYYLEAAEQSYEAHDLDATLSGAERGLGCGAQGEVRGALLSFAVSVYWGRERYGEVIARGTEAISLLPEGSKLWCRACHALFPATMMTQDLLLFRDLSTRLAGAEPSAEARGEYLRAMGWLTALLAIIGMKDASRSFLERQRQMIAALDAGELVPLSQIRSLDANDRSAFEEAPWACLVAMREARDLLCAAGDARNQCMAGAHLGASLANLGDLAGAEAELREGLAFAERLAEALPLTYAKITLAEVLVGSAPLDALDEPARLAQDVIDSRNMSLFGLAHGVLAGVKRRRGDLPGAEAEARAACEAASPFPPYGRRLVALLAQILLEQGRAAESLSVGEAGVRDMESLGLAGHGEIALRLAVAEARHAVGDTGAAREALADTLRRLWLRVLGIPEHARARYLSAVPANARVIALGRAWLGDEAVKPPGLDG